MTIMTKTQTNIEKAKMINRIQNNPILDLYIYPDGDFFTYDYRYYSNDIELIFGAINSHINRGIHANAQHFIFKNRKLIFREALIK